MSMNEEKTLYVNLFQIYAQYRNPFTFNYAQTFPLPPKSTIIGMLQNATGDYYDNAYNSLKISIHGTHQDIFWHYQRFIKGNTYLAGGNKLCGEDGKYLYNFNSKESQRSPKYQQEIFNLNLHLFIRGDELLEKIYKNLNNPRKILYLGRSEDVIFIRKVDFITKDSNKNITDKLFGNGFYLFDSKNEKVSGVLSYSNKLPVYYCPTTLGFKVKGKNLVEEEKDINKRMGYIFKNKDKIERVPTFKSAYFVDCSRRLEFNDEREFEVFKVGSQEFVISTDFGWA